MSMLIERARRWREERKQRWLVRGLQMGRAEGRVEGRAEGRLEGERELVRGLVYWRISEEAKEDFATVLAGISDSDRLIAIAADVLPGALPQAAGTRHVVRRGPLQLDVHVRPPRISRHHNRDFRDGFRFDEHVRLRLTDGDPAGTLLGMVFDPAAGA